MKQISALYCVIGCIFASLQSWTGSAFMISTREALSFVNMPRNTCRLSMKVVYPTRIRNVVSKLTQSTQKSLEKRQSRIEIELPPGVEFGVEKKGSIKNNAGDEAGAIQKSNREAARLITEMFSILASTTTVMFASQQEADAARNIWGSKFKGQVIALDVPAQSKKGYGKLRSRRFSAMEQEQVLMAPSDGGSVYIPEGTEVLIVVAPRGKNALKKVRSVHERFGPETLIILLNARTSLRDELSRSVTGTIDIAAAGGDTAASNMNKKNNKNTKRKLKDKQDNKQRAIDEEKPAPPSTLSPSAPAALAPLLSGADWIDEDFVSAFNYAPPILSSSFIADKRLKKRELLLYHEFGGDWYLAEQGAGTDSDTDGGAGVLEAGAGEGEGFFGAVGAAVKGAVSAATATGVGSFRTLWQGAERPSEQQVIDAVGAS